MAVTLTTRQTDKARALIKTEKICLTLQRHIDGDVELKPTQINAARILLDRSLPCLMAQTFSLDEDSAGLPLLTIIKNASDSDQAA